MNGILLADKPKGWTSFDVVNYVRKIVASVEGKKPKNVKVGHTGTLDPQATGLLVLLVGDYTKRASELSKLDKTYEVTMRLGQNSSTGDGEGEKTMISDRKPEVKEVQDTISSFEGEIEQIPPAYSAVKVNGQRAYKLAREGKTVELKPRRVTIYEIKDAGYSYPEIKFITRVSSGTYVRSLAEDIGKILKTGAYLAMLRRSEVGKYRLLNAIKTDELSAETIQAHLISDL